jgi:HD-GYP domain-containing protein (c-di-GMP phosphodiesterase class II)
VARDSAHSIVTSLPEGVYRSLSWGEESVRSCLTSIAYTKRDNDPKWIRRWVDYQLAAEPAGAILTCLDNALDQLRGAGKKSRLAADLRLYEQLRQAAGEHLTTRSKDASVNSIFSKELQLQADASVAMVKLWEPALAEHLEACGKLAERFARSIGLPETQIALSAMAARLHDIGVVGGARNLLQKPLALSNEEWFEIKQHPLNGYRALAAMEDFAEVAKIVRWHHERVDGSGYPDQLGGDEIPIEARLLSIVDAFVAMTVARPWSSVHSPQEAFRELGRCSGTQFDGTLVQEFLRLFKYVERADPAIDVSGFRAG